MHGWGKIMIGPTEAFLKGYADLGFVPPALFWGSFVVETLGGISLILGLFTRFFAAAAAIEMLVIIVIYWGNGFGWMKRGYEYVLLWGLVEFRHRAARRRPLFARSQARPGALNQFAGLVSARARPLHTARDARFCPPERWLSG